MEFGFDARRRPVSPHGREKFDDELDDFDIHEACLRNKALGIERTGDDLSHIWDNEGDNTPKTPWQTVDTAKPEEEERVVSGESSSPHVRDDTTGPLKSEYISGEPEDMILSKGRENTATDQNRPQPESSSREVAKLGVSKPSAVAEAKRGTQGAQNARTPVEPEDKKIYCIYNVGLKNCLDVPEGRNYEGRPIIEFEMNGSKSQMVRSVLF